MSFGVISWIVSRIDQKGDPLNHTKELTAKHQMQVVKPLSLCLCVLLAITGEIASAQSLRAGADKREMLIGAAVNPALFGEAAYAATLAREFNLVEAENVMKWQALRPSRESFDFAAGDAVITFARAHRMKVRGHCLLWSEHNPAWLTTRSFSPEQLSRLLREHINTVMKHYSGQVFAWDVVNEAFLPDGTIEPSIWYDSPGIGLAGKGTAYIEQAFRWARAADPKALLFYNDYDSENLNPKSDAIYAIVKDFKQRGVPIDGVGIQAHLNDLDQKEIESLAANLSRLTALGLQVHITEMDVALPLDATGALLKQDDLARQANIYRLVAKACLQQPGCTAFQTWGFTDKYSWIPSFTKGKKGRALLFDEAYAPKLAYKALRDVLEQPIKR
ncbi:MAG TPA: endo-1,4-beta-xylanase [Pyrinomonadaceae bacterium]|nr:endo-1,4-beta-xylanase [Pyrinomonadaceae bacterium]